MKKFKKFVEELNLASGTDEGKPDASNQFQGQIKILQKSQTQESPGK